MGVVNHASDRRGSQFYAFSEQIFTRQFSWQKFKEISQLSQSYDIVCQMALLGSKGLKDSSQGGTYM